MISGTRYQLRLEVNRQSRLIGEIGRAQAEISTGKKILSPSDDPAAAARISDIARSQANQTTWLANLDKAKALSAQAEGVLQSVDHAFTRATELIVAASNQPLSPQDRNAIALELESLAQHVAALRDTRDSRGDPLFSDGPALDIPVSANVELAAVAPRAAVFDSVVTPAGVTTLQNILRDAAIAVRVASVPAIATWVNEVKAAVGHVASVRAEHGARANRIDDFAEHLEAIKIGTADERKALESADITEVIARLQAKELSLEAAQAAFARIHRSNLFDLLG